MEVCFYAVYVITPGQIYINHNPSKFYIVTFSLDVIIVDNEVRVKIMLKQCVIPMDLGPSCLPVTNSSGTQLQAMREEVGSLDIAMQ